MLGVALSSSMRPTERAQPATPQRSGTTHRLSATQWRTRNHVTAGDRTGAPGRHRPVRPEEVMRRPIAGRRLPRDVCVRRGGRGGGLGRVPRSGRTVPSPAHGRAAHEGTARPGLGPRRPGADPGPRLLAHRSGCSARPSTPTTGSTPAPSSSQTTRCAGTISVGSSTPSTTGRTCSSSSPSGCRRRSSALAAPAAGLVRQAALHAADKLLERPRVQQLWANANRVAHERLVAVLKEEGTDRLIQSTNGRGGARPRGARRPPRRGARPERPAARGRRHLRSPTPRSSPPPRRRHRSSTRCRSSS